MNTSGYHNTTPGSYAMNHLSAIALGLLIAGLIAPACSAAEGFAIRPSDPPDMSATVRGEVSLPDGTRAVVPETVLRFEAPETTERTLVEKAPGSHASWWEPWQPWPKQGKPLALKPRSDENGTPILGGLFRQIDPGSVVVTTPDGARTFERDRDYVFNDDWGQVGNLDDRLGTPGEADVKATCTIAYQRLDLIQVGPGGTVNVKKGKSRVVCPALPEPDRNCAAVAGVYVAPWKREGRYVVTREDIFPIDPAPPVAPINPAAVAGTLARLRSGQEARIAFMGASITLGAEAGQWWDNLWTEKNLGYPSRVVVELRRRFPDATVTPVGAFQGGTQTKYGLEQMEKTVIPAKPNLVLIAFGGNDVAGPVGRPPNNPPEQFKKDIQAMVGRAKEAGMEVMLVVTMQQNPWHPNGVVERWPAYRQVLIDVANEEGVGCADVYTEWVNQATRGVPPWSQLHNWINHPGIAGHKLYADVILRFFE